MANIVITNLADDIYELRLNNAKHQNRLSDALCQELLGALDELAATPDLKVLLFAGQEHVFCAGAAAEMLHGLLAGDADAKDLLLPERVLSFPLPVIAALRGHAVGGGLTLALCCDLLVAAETSRYGMNFLEMGFTPGVGTTALLPATVGHHFASEMMLTTKLYKGRELQGRGLFNYVVKADAVEALALDLARRMAEKPRYALELLKKHMALPRRQALQAALAREHEMHKLCFDRPETAALIHENYRA
jgi:polyketide biosynthesis enoyl-CoA hydratase PksI